MRPFPLLSLSMSVLLVAATTGPGSAELTISNLSVYLNDSDVTVGVALLGAIPSGFTESIKSGVPINVRFIVELWQYRRMWTDRLLKSRTIERQLLYNVLTKEFKVASLGGEIREPYTSRELREAQRVVSELRGLKLLAAGELQPTELFYVRVHAEAALNGRANTLLTRLSGEADETAWVTSSLLTVSRTQ
jgi:uncharacterized protein DUF4390